MELTENEKQTLRAAADILDKRLYHDGSIGAEGSIGAYELAIAVRAVAGPEVEGVNREG